MLLIAQWLQKKRESDEYMHISIYLYIFFLLLFSTINNNYLCKQCILLLSSPTAQR